MDSPVGFLCLGFKELEGLTVLFLFILFHIPYSLGPFPVSFPVFAQQQKIRFPLPHWPSSPFGRLVSPLLLYLGRFIGLDRGMRQNLSSKKIKIIVPTPLPVPPRTPYSCLAHFPHAVSPRPSLAVPASPFNFHHLSINPYAMHQKQAALHLVLWVSGALVVVALHL